MIHVCLCVSLVSHIAIFVLKRDVKLQLTRLCVSYSGPCLCYSGPRALSAVGDVYCCLSSELFEFSVSASHVAAAACCVPLKEGMRPVVEETETDDKPVEKSGEIPAASEEKVAEEQPVYVTVWSL